ncbi:MBL fold metallo-hydrolase [Paenibacillus sp. UNC496MF]|uniref:MBL fold metallo-hydrolase n=1 Tax=Paenibacillus sp. UNC496MF TaxID=1502753 RepID=UPI000B2CA89B|nr:MBL fold metallo-hydrolase [Paenibacillus sp. UNC496MF]
MIDTGIAAFGDWIRAAAAKRFGRAKPRAIVLTHGHFDHVGSLKDLLALWDVPVVRTRTGNALPERTGRLSPADPSVGGGLMAAVSPLYPHKGIDVRRSLKELPPDGSITELPEWRSLHTPGHTRGHVSLFPSATGPSFQETRSSRSSRNRLGPY